VGRLEGASGREGKDIKLTTELLAAGRQKLAELGLDPKDTSGPELYYMLNEKLKTSDTELAEALELDVSNPDFLDDFAAAIKKLIVGLDTFAVKPSAAKNLFRVNPARRTMKTLGYRSFDSMLKHESLIGLYSGAIVSESPAWRKHFYNSYKSFKPSDFEAQPPAIVPLSGGRWQALAASFINENRRNLICSPEAGGVALLPLPEYLPGALTSMFLLTLANINEVLAAGSYLRLHIVKADFGEAVADVASHHLTITAPIGEQQLDWQTVHDFLAGNTGAGLEYKLAGDGISLINPVDALANLSPRLEFWRGSGYLAHVDKNEMVSLNPLDAALNVLNKLPFEHRVVDYCRQNLWRAFWQRYLQADILGEKLLEQLRHQLAEPELAPELEASEVWA
ncbi:MAG: hypothetical protein ACREHG_03125, partial [Candidatus Saccharimonadales bacterium]